MRHYVRMVIFLLLQGERFSLNMQLLHHDLIISRLSNLQHDTTFTNKCIYLVNIGSNDYINNYFFSDYYNTSRIYDPTQYAVNLIEQYSEQLMVGTHPIAKEIYIMDESFVKIVSCNRIKG